MPTDDFNFDQKKPGFDVIKDRVDKALKLMDTKGMAPIPGMFPLASAGKVIFRGYDGVYCVATREDKSADPPIKPGELLWKTETDQGLLQMVRGSRPANHVRPVPQHVHRERAALDPDREPAPRRR